MNGQMSANGYMVPKNLLVETIRAAFTVLWDENSPLKQVMKYTTVPRARLRKGLRYVQRRQRLPCGGFSPAIPVKNSMGRLFSHTTPMPSLYADTNCDFERMDTSGHVKGRRGRQLERQGNLHLTLSARTMSKNMPTYSVNIL